jgi:IclR family transcriptional regulator, acetate operon repressor
MTLQPGDRGAASRAVVKSADRALDVIECVAAAPAPITFTQILRALDVPKSSLSQLLINLVDRRYLELDLPTNVYRLGPGLLRLVDRASAIIPAQGLVEPVLRRLRDELNETAGFYVRHGDEVALAGVATSRHALVYIMNVGERAPLYAISPGKIILANMREDEFEAWLAAAELKSYTRKTIVDRDALRREILQARKSGFAFADQEFSLGIKGIACAVRSRDRCFGSVNISVPIARFDAALERAARSELIVAADHMARALAGRAAPSPDETERSA